MIRLNLVLLVAVLASALYLVNVQYESRRLYSALDKARAEGRKLESDGERLQVDKRAQARPQRIEKLAKDELQMRSVTPAITHYVSRLQATLSAEGLAPSSIRGNLQEGPVQ